MQHRQDGLPGRLRSFEDHVREHVFDPLGMEGSTFHFPRDATLMAKGYEADGVTEARYDHIILRPPGPRER